METRNFIQWFCSSHISHLFSINIKAQDPCKEGNFIELDHVAKRSPSFDMDSTPLCDRYITEEWYRAKYHVMSTSQPVLGKCGTLYPVWLRGNPVTFTFNDPVTLKFIELRF